MTRSIEEVARKLKYNFPLYSKNVLRIVNKEGESIPFRLNAGQRWVHSRFEKQLEEQGNIRALVLKARQTGISTYVEGRMFWKVTQNKNANAFVLSHLAESPNSIFNMVFMGSSQLGMLKFSRVHETESDKMGLVFMKLAGYEPNEAIAFWKKMSSQGINIPEIISTHPSDERRIKDIKDFIDNELDNYVN